MIYVQIAGGFVFGGTNPNHWRLCFGGLKSEAANFQQDVCCDEVFCLERMGGFRYSGMVLGCRLGSSLEFYFLL